MIKRVVLAVVSLAAGALVLAAPASFGAAAQASTSTGAAPAVDWGPNHDGWHVHLTNDTRYVALNIRELFDNVSHVPKQIPPFTTATDIRGVKSLFGGPANMHVRYKLDGTQGGPLNIPVQITVFIRSDSSGKVSVSCDIERPLQTGRPKGFGCLFGHVVSNRPIPVRVFTTVP